MKISITVLLICLTIATAFAQVDKVQLALEISKADEANTEKLKAFVWKRNSTVIVNGEEKVTMVNELSFDESGKIQVTNISTESNTKKKPGVRGKIQQNAIEENVDYISDALSMALSYTYMSKGQLIDFLEKSTVAEVGNTYEITGSNIYVVGDTLTIVVEKETKLFLNKKFSSKIGEDPIEGEINYVKFNSGVSHGSETTMKLPAKKSVITAKNVDYTQRVN